MDDLIRRSDAIRSVLGITMLQGRVPMDTVIYQINSIPAVEPCKDAISREWMLNELEEMNVANFYELNEHSNEMYGQMKRMIKAAPSVNVEPKHGEWIPCEERLPEDIRPVLVTWKNNDPKSYYQYIVGKHFIGTAHYHRGKWYWYSSVTEDLLAEYGKCDGEEFDEAIEVVAWMPLPEPYMKGADDED